MAKQLLLEHTIMTALATRKRFKEDLKSGKQTPPKQKPFSINWGRIGPDVCIKE